MISIQHTIGCLGGIRYRCHLKTLKSVTYPIYTNIIISSVIVPGTVNQSFFSPQSVKG